MQYSGIKLTTNIGTIDKLQPLKLAQCLKGEYDISYRFLSTDLNDSLNLVVGSGLISVSLNNGSTWTKIDRSYSFNYNKNFSKFKLRIDSKSASFALVANDHAAVSTPKIQLNLGSGFDFDMPDTKYYSWSMGSIDPLTGLSWNNGRVTRSDSMIGISITETIGGDDVSDYAKFSLNESSKIRLDTIGAISQIINYKGLVVADSSDSYNSTIEANLTPGTYYIGFSTESSTAETFTSSVSFI